MANFEDKDKILQLTEDEVTKLSSDDLKKCLTTMGAAFESNTPKKKLLSRLVTAIALHAQPVPEPAAPDLQSLVAGLTGAMQAIVDRLPSQTQQAHGTGSTRHRASAQAPPVLQDDVDYSGFEAWWAAWSHYAKATGLVHDGDEAQVNSIFTYFAPDLQTKLEFAAEITSETVSSSSELHDRVSLYLRDQLNIVLDRYRFFTATKDPAQSFEDYYVRVMQMAKTGQIRDMMFEDLVMTVLLSGHDDESLRQEAMRQRPALDLKGFVNFCRAKECAAASNQIFSHAVGAIQHPNRSRQSVPDVAKRSPDSRGPIGTVCICERCGYAPHTGGKTCPACNQKCNKCGKLGHFASRCQNKRPPTTVNRPTNACIEGAGESVGVIEMDLLSVIRTSQPIIDVQVKCPGGAVVTVPALADTGACLTVAGLNWKDAISDTTGRPPDPSLKLLSASRQDLRCVATAPATISVGGKVTKEHVHFCSNVARDAFYLSLRACRDLGVVHKEFPTPIFSVARGDGYYDHILSEYSDVFNSSLLKPMVGEPMEIMLKDHYVPNAAYVCRHIPFPIRDQIKTEIDDLVAQGIVEPVGDRPTEFCHPIVLPLKKDGTRRLTVDFTKLNPFVKRVVHPAPTPWEAVSQVPSCAKVFTVLDARKGYWQLPLKESSRDLTTFITPWGRFRYCRAPMGFISTGDHYNLRGDIALQGLPNVVKLVDDILIWSDNTERHMTDVEEVLQRCRKAGITLNPKKCHFAKESVLFAGFVVSQHGTIQQDPTRVEAITKFPPPNNLPQLRSFVGLANQFTQFSSELSEKLVPLRSLLSPKNEFLWTSIEQQAFDATKALLASPPVLSQFDATLETQLETDASRLYGLGFALLQRHPDGWRPVQFGSRFLTDAETRYATIELEALAISFAVKKCRLYLFGLPAFVVITDHRPLVQIFNKHSLPEVENVRLQKIKSSLQSAYTFHVEWRKGKQNFTADGLSRSPVADYSASDEDDEDSDVMTLAPVLVEDDIRQCLTEASSSSARYQELRDALTLENVRHTPYVAQFKSVLTQLSVQEPFILLGNKIVIPPEAVKSLLKHLHSPHQGVDKSLARARQIWYWPGMTNDIRQMCSRCEACQTYRPSQQKESLMAQQTPSEPYHTVSADFFAHAGRHFLVYADRYTGYIKIAQFRSVPNASETVATLRRWFAEWGAPVILQSDNGPQFRASKTSSFLASWGVQQEFSSPHYPQSNGHAEAAVKVVKSMMKKIGASDLSDWRFINAWSEFNNMPRNGGLSPNELVFGRRLRTKAPQVATDTVVTDGDLRRNEEAVAKKRERNTEVFDRNSRDLAPLGRGSMVRMQDPDTKLWKTKAVVVHCGKRRNYIVETTAGTRLWHNRKALRLQQEPEGGDGDVED